MASFKTRRDFMTSEEGLAIMSQLRHMTLNALYNTASSYSANSTQYPDNLIPFVDKHLNYLNAHPKLDAKMYLANLQLITRVR